MAKVHRVKPADRIEGAPAAEARPRRLPAPTGEVKIIPSLLAADFGDLAGAVRLLEDAAADWASIDVMDGHFVPNLSFGPDHVRALRPRTQMILDAHLMVDDPRRFAPIFAEAGADLVLVHLEACPKPQALLREVRAQGKAAGLSVKPATPASALLPYLGEIDFALVMTVEPGFGGQAFQEKMVPKIRALRRAIDRRKLPVWLGVDGGIRPGTAETAAAAGADALVAGSAVFGAPDPKVAYHDLRRAAQTAFDRKKK